jgi:hypothetical protein
MTSRVEQEGRVELDGKLMREHRLNSVPLRSDRVVKAMARRISLPVKVEFDASDEPTAFTWRGVRRRVRVIGRWHLRNRWWQPREKQSDRRYFRLLTAATRSSRCTES